MIIWANPEQTGVLVIDGDHIRFIDSGAEYDDTVAAGPQPFAGPLDIGSPVDKTPIRVSAVVTKAVFCSALWRAGILSKPEAVKAARGEWPAAFAAFTAGLSEADATDAEIKWAAVTEIHYADPLLQGLALYQAQGDQVAATALLDQIFGIA